MICCILNNGKRMVKRREIPPLIQLQYISLHNKIFLKSYKLSPRSRGLHTCITFFIEAMK